jgi:hypothetical protein
MIQGPGRHREHAWATLRPVAATHPPPQKNACPPLPEEEIAHWNDCPVHSQNRIHVIRALSDILKFMTGSVLHWFSAAWTRLGRRHDLLLEFIVLRHQLAML